VLHSESRPHGQVLINAMRVLSLRRKYLPTGMSFAAHARRDGSAARRRMTCVQRRVLMLLSTGICEQRRIDRAPLDISEIPFKALRRSCKTRLVTNACRRAWKPEGCSMSHY